MVASGISVMRWSPWARTVRNRASRHLDRRGRRPVGLGGGGSQSEYHQNCQDECDALHGLFLSVIHQRGDVLRKSLIDRLQRFINRSNCDAKTLAICRILLICNLLRQICDWQARALVDSGRRQLDNKRPQFDVIP